MKINASSASMHCGVSRQLKPLETVLSLTSGWRSRCLSRGSRTRPRGGWHSIPMGDEAGNTVACRVSHEALRDHADRTHYAGTDGAVFTEN